MSLLSGSCRKNHNAFGLLFWFFSLLSRILLFRTRHAQSLGSSNSGRNWGCGPCRGSAAVVCHVRPDEMASGQCGAQTQFSRKDGSTNNPRQLTGVVAGAGGVRTAHAKQVKHGRLAFKDSTTTNSSNFNRGH